MRETERVLQFRQETYARLDPIPPSEMPFVSEMQLKFSKWRYSFQSSRKIIYVLQFLDCLFFFLIDHAFSVIVVRKVFFFLSFIRNSISLLINS